MSSWKSYLSSNSTTKYTLNIRNDIRQLSSVSSLDTTLTVLVTDFGKMFKTYLAIFIGVVLLHLGKGKLWSDKADINDQYY